MRLGKLRNLMQKENVDALIIANTKNRRYFSQFSGSAGILVITKDSQQIITDFRYIEQAKIQTSCYNYNVVEHEAAKLYETVASVISQNLNPNAGQIAKTVRIGFEGDYTTFNTYKKLTENLSYYELVPLNLDEGRMVKDQEELALIKKAVSIADQAFSQITGHIKPGISETEIALELEYYMRKLGSEKPAFDTIVASGARGALPHGQASPKLLDKGDLVTIDFGAVYQGYHSDMTRTIAVGKASPRQREIYEIVLTAQLTGLEAVKAGKISCEVDAAARKIIEKAGYGQYFGHGLGHSVGLAVHEPPSLSPKGRIKLEPGMVVSVEPGIYIPGWGGVRIEDLVLVLPGGKDVLTTSCKQLIEVN